MGAFLFETPFFFPLRDASQVKRNLPTQWPECKSVCVCLLLCEQCMFHYQTLFSVLNGTFFFWCGLEKPFQGKAGSIAFVFGPLFGWSLRHSAQGSALFLPGWVLKDLYIYLEQPEFANLPLTLTVNFMELKDLQSLSDKIYYPN